MEGSRALRIFGICGLASVLVDLDHLIAIILWRFWFPQITEGRIWHTPLFILVGSAICYMVSYHGGLRARLVLVGIIVITVLILIYSPLVVWDWSK